MFEADTGLMATALLAPIIILVFILVFLMVTAKRKTKSRHWVHVWLQPRVLKMRKMAVLRIKLYSNAAYCRKSNTRKRAFSNLIVTT